MEATIQEIFENLLTALNVNFSHTEVIVKPEEDDEEGYYCNVVAKESSHLIGRHGRTLQALQHILKLIVFKRLDKHVGITVDVDSYRKRQEESVLELAKRHIEKVRTSKERQSMPAMSPYFRRLVHLYIAQSEFDDISTTSEGYGTYRHVVILPHPTQ